MPSLFTLLNTGSITNSERNSDRPASTWFGGTVLRPSALRVSDSTTKILVKLVTSSSSDGATDSSVTSSRMLSDVLGLLGSFTVTSDGAVGAVGAVGPSGVAGAAATGSAATGSAAT